MAQLQRLQPSAKTRAQDFEADLAEARAELWLGLSQNNARLSPKYFYDALGSKLFEAICALDEYYLTRAETSIFMDYAEDIAAATGQGATLIDLGAGNCAKAASLFDVLKPQQYVPVDISVSFVQAAALKLAAEHPQIAILPVGLDFTDNLHLPSAVNRQNRLFFYPGSSIGNYTPLQAMQFLKRIHAVCETDGGLLIGIDLVKDHAVLQAAYDDALGVTAAFNLNALRHVNQLLESDFDVRAWQHRALFNAEQSRIEMHLEARQALNVAWPGGSRAFAAGERIHTENSYKYTERSFLELLSSAGFGETLCWTDPARHFLVCYARAI